MASRRPRKGGGPKSSGLNPSLRAQNAANADYQAIMNQVLDTILEMAKSVSVVHAAIGCKWGKRRSEAMTEDLGYQLHALVGSPIDYDVRMMHLERFRWDKHAREVSAASSRNEPTATHCLA